MENSSTSKMQQATPVAPYSYLNDSGYRTSSPSPLYFDSSGESCERLLAQPAKHHVRKVSETPVTGSQKTSVKSGLIKFLREPPDEIQEPVASEVNVPKCLQSALPVVYERRSCECSVTVDEYSNSSLADSFGELHVVECSKIESKEETCVPSPSNSLPEVCVLEENDSEDNVEEEYLIHGLRKRYTGHLEKNCAKKLRIGTSGLVFPFRDVENKANRYTQGLIGTSHLDFFIQLADVRSIPGVLSLILSFLAPQDLVTVCKVSRAWRRLCVADLVANRRRLAYVRHVQHSKENLTWNEFKQIENPLPSLHKGVFREIQNVDRRSNVLSTPRSAPRSPPVSPSKVRFHMFLKAGGGLEQGTRLVPCPRCSHPSRAGKELARCQAVGCRFTFCLICLCEAHEGRVCPSRSGGTARRKTSCVGSKESRRNLRRL